MSDMRFDIKGLYTDREALKSLGETMARSQGVDAADTRPDTVWKAVKAALKTYAAEYPKTWAGKFINRVWGRP